MLEDDVVLEGVKGAPIALQRIGNPCIARQCVWLVVAVGENRVDPKVHCKLRNLFGGYPMQTQQRSSVSVQPFRELSYRTMDELDAAISGGPVHTERIEN